jgi:tetratricopeptide (TPR) repeat protein
VARRQFGDLIARGVEALQQRHYGDALVEFRGALGLRSLDAEAQSLYGLTLVRLKRYDEAEPFLRKAVQREPNEPGFRFNLAELYEVTRRNDAAAEQLEAIVERRSNDARAWSRLGRIRALQARREQSRDAYRRAHECDPTALEYLVELCRACVALGDEVGATEALDAALKVAPDQPATLRLQIERLTALRRWRELEAIGRRVADAHPSEPIGWFAQSRALLEQGRYRESEQAYRGVLERTGESPQNLTAHARLCLFANDLARARAALDRAEAAGPDLPEMLAAKGLVETYFGRFDEARAYCRRSIERNPDYVPAYSQLSRLDRGRFSDIEIARLERLSNDATIPHEHRIGAAFVYADALDAASERERAFAAYKRANALAAEAAAAEGLVYEASASEAKVRRLRTLFAAAPEAGERGVRNPTPIFIVGMPRSGTTLVESIVSAHPRVFGAGERGMMQRILAEFLTDCESSGGAWPPADRIEGWIDAYQREGPPLGRADHVTDKHPLNFEAVGLIARLFPEAPIIHVRRNPIETGWSIFHHEFSKFWTFAHRLEDIGHFYGQYARLVAHWQRILGDRFVTVQYETLVADFEQEARRIVAACGLAWEPRCLDFQNADRPITTFSAVQAREPVTLRNGAAMTYRVQLEPLVRTLEAAGVDIETGALRSAPDASAPDDSAERSRQRGLRGLWRTLSGRSKA